MRDFINFTQEHCKKIMLEYQTNKDSESFHLLLAKYDRYLLKVIYDFQRRCTSLRVESLQELYHTSIMGFHKAILSLKEEDPSKYLCNHIQAYVVSELKQTYIPSLTDRKLKEVLFTPKESKEVEDLLNHISADMLLNSKVITGEEKKLLKMYYLKGLCLREISDKVKRSEYYIWDKLQKAKEKLQKLANS